MVNMMAASSVSHSPRPSLISPGLTPDSHPTPMTTSMTAISVCLLGNFPLPAVGDDLDIGSVMNRAHNRALTIARERIAHLKPEAVLSSGV